MPSIRLNVTLPKEKFSDKKFVDSILDKMKTKTIPDLKNLFKQTTDGWQHKPDWGSRQWHNSSEIGSFVFADGTNADIYALVSKGSPSHRITPKSNNGFLRFQPGYSAATTPGTLRSGPKSRSGGFVKAKAVNHPGFAAREFPATIKKEYENTFAKDMQDAINNAAKS